MESLAETSALIERSALVKDLVRCLRDDTRSGALIVGGAGAGKTAVLKAAIRELEPHRHLIRLTATSALASVPFGALAPYLSRLPDRELDSYAAVVEAMARSLKSEADRPLFVVDDAHCLDHGTVRQLAQAAATGAAGILVACRPGPMIPEEFLALWDDGIIAKFDLYPLSRIGTHQLCEQVLRADVSPWVSALFHKAADGNPLMLMSLIQHARASGALGLRHGVWFLLANPDMAQVPAADVVDRQLRSMTPEEKTAATIVAMAGPLSLSQILRISGPKAVDALDTAGIIAVSTGHDRLVRAASPILGEIIRQRVPAGRSSALRSSVLSLPSARAAAPGAALNRLRWSMDCGVEIPPIQLLQAAVAANTAPGPCDRVPGGWRHPGRPVPPRGPDPAGLFALHRGCTRRPLWRVWSPHSRCPPDGRPTWLPSSQPGSGPQRRPGNSIPTPARTARPLNCPSNQGSWNRVPGIHCLRISRRAPTFPDALRRDSRRTDSRRGLATELPESLMGRQVHGSWNRAARTHRRGRRLSRNPGPGSFPPRRTLDRPRSTPRRAAFGRRGMGAAPDGKPGTSLGLRGPRGAPLPESDLGRRLGPARKCPGRLRGP